MEEEIPQVPLPASTDPSNESVEVYSEPIKDLEQFKSYLVSFVDYCKRKNFAHFKDQHFDPNLLDQSDFDFWKYSIVIITLKYRINNSSLNPDSVITMFDNPSKRYISNADSNGDALVRSTKHALKGFLANMVGHINTFVVNGDPVVAKASFRKRILDSTMLDANLIDGRGEYR